MDRYLEGQRTDKESREATRAAALQPVENAETDERVRWNHGNTLNLQTGTLSKP